MIKGIGTDIIDVKRIKGVIERTGERFYTRILTENEIAYCKTFAKPEQHFAGRFAAKEAYSKSLGTGVGKDYSWKDIEILNDERGKPYVKHLKENEFSKDIYHVSISHTDDYACAMVTREE